MSTEKPAQSTSSAAKPLTGNFELETRIRLIIQEVLNATMRKISQLHEKVDNFEQFFFTFKQRITEMEEKGHSNENSLLRTQQTVNKNRADAESSSIRLEEAQERTSIEMKTRVEEIKEINKKLSQISRQNETLNNELSKTKAKFLEYSDQMTALKEEVAWKISKYVEETAEVNTQIKVSNEEIKKEYFNVQLGLEANKRKYDEIIQSKDMQETYNARMREDADTLQAELALRREELKELNKKLEEMDTSLYSKIKLTESKLEKRIDELFDSNKKIVESVRKVDKFADLLDEVREDTEKLRLKLLKKFEQADLMQKNRLEQEVLTLNKGILEFEKKTDKKVKKLEEGQEKTVEFFTQKMEFLKVELETEISSKASRMLEEKSKSASGAASSALEELHDRIAKVTLDTTKSVNKLEAMVREVKSEVKTTMTDFRENIETMVSATVRNLEESAASGVSPELMKSINEKIEKVSENCESQIFTMNKDLSEQKLKVLAVERLKEEIEVKFLEMIRENTRNFQELEGKITGKVEKVMFLVTKMRGDAIIRNEFTDKEIKELKKMESSSKAEIQMINHLIPAFGECINLMMCLIYDAEYQHSKIILDNLPTLGKDNNKFQNILEGVLYEYSEKKKPGVIMYRHKEQKKTDIVRATFSAYIQVWEELFRDESKLKEKQDFIPRFFYRKFIEKGPSKNSSSSSPRKDLMSQPLAANQRHPGDFNSTKELPEDSRPHASLEATENMNRSSFQIRKKKTAARREREEAVVVVRDDLGD